MGGRGGEGAWVSWGGGGASQESAVISHETKAHSARLWLVSHLESSLRAFEAPAGERSGGRGGGGHGAETAARCPAEARRGRDRRRSPPLLG